MIEKIHRGRNGIVHEFLCKSMKNRWRSSNWKILYTGMYVRIGFALHVCSVGITDKSQSTR